MLFKLENKYQEFFDKFNVNLKTGCLKNGSNLKFATYPYIGSKYGKSIKILIVGLDIGSDEIKGRFQSYEERRISIEDKNVSEYNPHIAGTYFTALFFLKNKLNLQNYWKEFKNKPTFQQVLKNNKKLPNINPLSYVALTNLYKFVSINRKNRDGGENRKYQDKAFELNFLNDEIRILKPDIIIFQSESFWNKKDLLDKLSKFKSKIYIGPHPSWRKSRKPSYFIKQIIKY